MHAAGLGHRLRGAHDAARRHGYTSIEIKVSYLRPVHAGAGELTAHGWVMKAGRRVAFTEGVVSDAAGKVVATATSSLLVMAPG